MLPLYTRNMGKCCGKVTIFYEKLYFQPAISIYKKNTFNNINLRTHTMRSNLQENFYKRLRELAKVKSANNPTSSLSNSTLIEYSRANDGIALGIVKENHSYFIKTSGSKGEKLGAEDFAYIGGVENKYRYQYSSLAEAEKNRNFYIKTLNESSSKKFKTIAVNEGENISKAQVNGDSLNAGKAQTEADKSKGGAALKDTAKEKAPGEVPSVAAIAVEKEADKAKVVDDTKVSSAKPISVDKKQIKPKTTDVAKVETSNKIQEGKDLKEYGNEHEVSVDDALKNKVAENFGQEEEEPSLGGDSPAAALGDEPALGGGSDDAAAGSAEPELDAAAAALDSMGAGDASPEAELGGDPSLGGEPSLGGDVDGAVKDIEKLTGKVTQKIRSTELTPEMTKGFLKSYITAFEDKISGLEHEDRKELAASILKDKEEGESELGAEPSLGGEEPSLGDSSSELPTEDSEEKEIEEAINQHLAEMGIGEDENVENHEDITTTQKPFKKYVAERGYNPENIQEISLMEMVGLVNGYTNECGDDSDAEGMSDFVSSEVAAKVNESGNSLFEDLMKPFGEKIKKNKKAYAVESVIPMNEIFGDEEGAEEEEEESADEPAIGGDNSPETSIAVGEEPVGGEEEEEASIEAEPVSVEKEISIAPAADAIAIGTPIGGAMGGASAGEGTKSATVDLKNATVTLTMNEAEVKLRKIIQKKISEALAGKKPSINETKKSALSIMIDEAINEALTKRRAAIEKALLRPRK